MNKLRESITKLLKVIIIKYDLIQLQILVQKYVNQSG